MTRIDFETAATGSLPSGVTAALTGSGGPVAWTVVEDPTAPAGPKVLAQTSTDKTDHRFPLAIFAAPVAADIDVAVRFKPVAGEVDRAAGIAVRLSDPNNYYVVRANALEDNVRLYRMVGGRRSQFAGADAKVPSRQMAGAAARRPRQPLRSLPRRQEPLQRDRYDLPGRRPRGALDQGRQRHSLRRSQDPDSLGKPSCPAT